MKPQEIEFLILGLTYVQMELQNQRRDHNGNVLKHDDIDELQRSIEILKIIKMDLKNDENNNQALEHTEN
jgi:hypothetical protein